MWLWAGHSAALGYVALLCSAVTLFAEGNRTDEASSAEFSTQQTFHKPELLSAFMMFSYPSRQRFINSLKCLSPSSSFGEGSADSCTAVTHSPKSKSTLQHYTSGFTGPGHTCGHLAGAKHERYTPHTAASRKKTQAYYAEQKSGPGPLQDAELPGPGNKGAAGQPALSAQCPSVSVNSQHIDELVTAVDTCPFPPGATLPGAGTVKFTSVSP